MRAHSTRTTRTLAAGLFAVAGLGLAGCGSEGPETGADVEDVTDGEVVESSAAATEDPGAMALAYEGDYNQDFYDEVTTYTGQQVTLSAEVSETISPDTFAIAGAVDPLLIVEEQEIPPLDDGQVVQVTGTVQEGFDVAGVEQELGVDLEDEAFTEFEGEPYIMATSGEVIDQE
ncbi:hypothetical protein [Kocuria oceani]|uniref:Lipoprotein n=1 Tax=Kocuria oceani TaxID=988827 RepID=A0ABV9TGF2_9MICC|nr:hypothetical protein [Kocuria oceani]